MTLADLALAFVPRPRVRVLSILISNICGVMDEAIDRGERHCGIGKDLALFAERLVGGDEHGPALVAGDKLE